METWPGAKNMKWTVIRDIFNNFDKAWGKAVEEWFDEEEFRKGHVNSLVNWRNDIAHGNESRTGSVTIVSVGERFKTVNKLLDYLEVELVPIE